MPPEPKPIIISVGGSLIVPDQIDIVFLKAFKAFIISRIEKGESFIIIAGGGKSARRYQEAANTVTPLTSDDLDWLGIHATRLNGHLMRSIFYEHAHPVINTNPNEPVPTTHTVVIAAGWIPGWSTDYDAVLLASNVGAKTVINLSNIDYAYTADPNKDKDAKPIEKSTWTDFRKLLPEKWDPGLSSPFDPMAAKEAQALGLEVAIINGAKLDEVANFLDEKPFTGTLIAN
jgi:uridylate kinase